jgi:hypothetical protein
MSPHAPRPPSRIVSFAIPAIEPRQAEVLMDLLEQLQAAIWEAYGEAILAAVDDSCKDVEDAPSSGSDDSSPF